MLSNALTVVMDIGAAERTGSLIKTVLIAVMAVIIVILIAETVYLAITCTKLAKKLKAGSKKKAADITSIEVGKLHEQGKREYQQDSFSVSDSSLLGSLGLLAIVADGMGGLSDGDKVSVRTVEKALDGFVACPETMVPHQILLFLAQCAVQSVNDLLGPENFRRSGSTLVMGLIKNNMLSFLSIGDSRIYLYRDGVLYQLNREHVYRNELTVKAVNNKITFQEAYNDKSGSGLTSYIGMGDIAYIDYPASPLKLYPGDKVVMMSDGVYNAVSDEELSSALSHSPAEAVDELREVINKKAFSNQDNYTCVVLECRTGSVNKSRPKPQKKRPSQTIIPA